jgi:hypothetical protein
LNLPPTLDYAGREFLLERGTTLAAGFRLYAGIGGLERRGFHERHRRFIAD